jgi:hypothetical protein
VDPVDVGTFFGKSKGGLIGGFEMIEACTDDGVSTGPTATPEALES